MNLTGLLIIFIKRAFGAHLYLRISLLNSSFSKNQSSHIMQHEPVSFSCKLNQVVCQNSIQRRCRQIISALPAMSIEVYWQAAPITYARP